MSMTPRPKDLLRTWLLEQDTQGAERLAHLLDEYRANPTRRTLFRVLALASRALGVHPLGLAPADLEVADRACPGWRPDGWRRDHAARTLVLLEVAEVLPADAFHQELGFLFGAADVGELEALYRALILFPEPQRLLPRAMEATRTNMTRVFTALAYGNPYPATLFEEDTWNRMILKAVFLSLPLDPIQGLDHRANRSLSVLLLDYVRERWAARRPVRWDVWRCAGPFANLPAESAFFERLLKTGSEVEKQAAVLALCGNPSPRAAILCAAQAELIRAARNGRLAWHLLSAVETIEATAHLAGPI
jgi:hypothetical protein